MNRYYAGAVWILAGMCLTAYCVVGLLNASVPGAENLVAYITAIQGKYVYAAAFLSIFIEGLYLVGSEEGFVSVAAVALISFAVGAVALRKAFLRKQEEIGSKYCNPENLIRDLGWTHGQIARYLKFLEEADPETLRGLHRRAGIKMFEEAEKVDPEQAVLVLVNGKDIRKEELFKIIDDHFL